MYTTEQQREATIFFFFIGAPWARQKTKLKKYEKRGWEPRRDRTKYSKKMSTFNVPTSATHLPWRDARGRPRRRHPPMTLVKSRGQGGSIIPSVTLRAFVLDPRSRAFEVASLADMDFHEEDASRLFGTHRTKNLRENHATKTFRTVYFSAEEANYTRC